MGMRSTGYLRHPYFYFSYLICKMVTKTLKIGVFVCVSIVVSCILIFNNISYLKQSYYERTTIWIKWRTAINVSHVNVPYSRTCFRYSWWSNSSLYTETDAAFQFVLLDRLPGEESTCGYYRGDPNINQHLRQGLWHDTDTGQEIYVKSAYYDNRTNAAKVRLIGVSPLVNARFYCQFYYKGGRVTSRLGYAVSDTYCPIQKGFRYRPHMYICDVAGGEPPTLVSLVSTTCQYTTNWIKVTNNMSPLPQNKVGSIGLCLKTLFNLHSKKSLHQLIEFVELNKLLGISDIYIYGYHNVSKGVEGVLTYYNDTGGVHIVPWRLPTRNMRVMQYLQLSAINDCFYSNMNKHEFLAVYDIDEFIIPRKKDLLTILSQLKSQHRHGTTFSFRNVFYNANNYSTTDADVNNKRYAHNVALSHTLHQTLSNIGVMPGKSVYLPETVVYSGVHFSLSVLPGYEYRILVSPKLATVHHYRQCGRTHSRDAECINPAHIRDRIVHRYKKELLKAKMSRMIRQ